MNQISEYNLHNGVYAIVNNMELRDIQDFHYLEVGSDELASLATFFPIAPTKHIPPTFNSRWHSERLARFGKFPHYAFRIKALKATDEYSNIHIRQESDGQWRGVVVLFGDSAKNRNDSIVAFEDVDFDLHNLVTKMQIFFKIADRYFTRGKT